MDFSDLFLVVERVSIGISSLALLITILIKFLGQEWFNLSKELKAIRFAQQKALGKADDPKAVVAILSTAAHVATDNIPALPPPSTGTPASQVARARLVLRLAEADVIRTSQRRKAARSSAANVALVITQYIIGGVLASSFVQESLSPKTVGGLGVLVLLASLVKQQFHFDADAQMAAKNVRLLAALIRSSEDELSILDAKMPAARIILTPWQHS